MPLVTDDLKQQVGLPPRIYRCRKLLCRLCSRWHGLFLLGILFREQNSGTGVLHRITDIGRDPWLVKEPSRTVKLKRADAASLKVTPLDFNGPE